MKYFARIVWLAVVFALPVLMAVAVLAADPSTQIDPAKQGEAIQPQITPQGAVDIGVIDDITTVLQRIQRELLEKGGFLHQLAVYLASSFAVMAIILVVGARVLAGEGDAIIRTGVRMLVTAGVLLAVINMWTPDNLEMGRRGALSIAQNVFKATHVATGMLRGGGGAKGMITESVFGRNSNDAGIFDHPSYVSKDFFGFGTPTNIENGQAVPKEQSIYTGDDAFSKVMRTVEKGGKKAASFVANTVDTVAHPGRIIWKALLAIVLFVCMGVITLYLIMLNMEWYIVTTFATITMPFIVIPALRQVSLHTLHMVLTLFLKYAAYALMIGLLLSLYKIMMSATMIQTAAPGFGPLSPGYLDRLVASSDPLLMFGCMIIILVLLMSMPTIVGRLVGQSLGMSGMAAGKAVGIATTVVGVGVAAAGAAVGGLFGGPAGAVAGASAGKAVGGAVGSAARPSMPQG